MASFSSEHEAPAGVPTGAPSGATIEETTVSFSLPAVCNDRFNYRLNGPIDLHCRISGLFESIDRLFNIAALLPSFDLSAFHFFLHFVVLARRSFFPCFSPLFCLFRSESEAMRESLYWSNHQMSPIGDNLESPLANGYLVIYFYS